MSGSPPVCVAAKPQERGRESVEHILPLELTREILLRLPVRSVLRFKCVCKAWHSLISDPQFSISHYDLAASPSHRILIRSTDFYVESIDTDAQLGIDHYRAVNFLLPPPSPPLRRKYDYYASSHGKHKHEILGSCRGLVLLYYERTRDFILWNPSLGDHKRVTNMRYKITYLTLYGLGYDASTDDYLLILVEAHRMEIRVFSFKTHSWNKNNIDALYRRDDYRFNVGSLFRGVLHWIVYSPERQIRLIIAFDMMQRSLSEIPLPDQLNMDHHHVYSLTVVGGCLTVCCSVQDYEMEAIWGMEEYKMSENIEIWVMEEYKVQSSWTKSIVIPVYGIHRSFFSPLCITKDGGIFGSNIRGRLEKINDKGELLEYLTYGRGRQPSYQDNLQSALYRESLLSLPSVIPKTKEDDHGKTSEDDDSESEYDHEETSDNEW